MTTEDVGEGAVRMMRLILCCLCVLPALWARSVDESHHPDGSLAHRIPLDRDGQQHGRYTRYHPSGDADRRGAIAEQGSFVRGALHGVRTRLDADGSVIAEEQWVGGRLLLPMTERFLRQREAQLQREAAIAVAGLEAGDGQWVDRETLVAVLARANHYRLLCGLPSDLVFDSAFIHKAQCAAEVCAGMGRLNHHPQKNPGLDEERWLAGKEGCGKSNLAMGGVGARAVDMWMDDSDASNRARVGHRRWILWHELDRIGYGHAGRFSALFVLAPKRDQVPTVPMITFPPAGLIPLSMFGDGYCWHASPDPDLYTLAKDASMEIRPIDLRSGRTGDPLDIQFRNRDGAGIAGRQAIIALPAALPLRKGAAFEVTLVGVSKKVDTAPDPTWITIFY